MQILQESTCVGVFIHKVEDTRHATLLKRDSTTGNFLWNLRNFWESRFTEHIQWLLQKVSGFQTTTLLKKRLWKRYFSVNFAKFLRTSFLLTEYLRMTASSVYLRISRSSSERFFYRAPRGNCYFMCKLQNFNQI